MPMGRRLTGEGEPNPALAGPFESRLTGVGSQGMDARFF